MELKRYLPWAIIGFMFGVFMSGFPPAEISPMRSLVTISMGGVLGTLLGLYIVAKGYSERLVNWLINYRKELVVFCVFYIAGYALRAVLTPLF